MNLLLSSDTEREESQKPPRQSAEPVNEELSENLQDVTEKEGRKSDASATAKSLTWEAYSSSDGERRREMISQLRVLYAQGR